MKGNSCYVLVAPSLHNSFFDIGALIQEDLLELFRYKLAAELVLSKDNKQQCFKSFKALKNRAIGFFFQPLK
nr:hypothetical protein CFP56_23603 [Quercus suber]